MSSIVMVGLNHRTSPIEVREKFYFLPSEKEILLSELKSNPKVVEAFILSTCNRTEIYAVMIEATPDVLLEAIFNIKKINGSIADFKEYFYFHIDKEAVRHLLSVSAGLDSLVLGEKQILAQIKEAFSLATSKIMMGRSFNILSNFVLQTGRKARRETQIDFGGVSVSGAAVAMAQSVWGTLENKTVLILGSGKMSTLALQHLKAKGVGRIFVMNRTMSKAEELASASGAEAVAFWDINQVLQQTDVCICSTGCPHYLVDKDLVESVMSHRPNRQLVFVDISVPRNINPTVSEVEAVSIFTVDDLDRVVGDNIKKRLMCVGAVEKIVEDKLEEFYSSLYKTSKPQFLNI
ncbi:MAG: glutamyl-tRNA reductase [Candidatus Omnitrophota bacterium]